MTRRLWTKITGGIAAVAMTLMLAPAATVMAVERPETTPTLGNEVAGVELPKPVAVDASGHCDIWRGIHKGRTMCESFIWREANFQWPDGRLETFIVGIDLTVHHIWQRWAGDTEWSGWAPQGGIAHSGVYYFGFTSTGPLVGVVGQDPNGHCKVYNGGWSNWFHC
ncbi:hypothetical protein LWC34_45075 [Kibdelosporangium philippinense]|uniref:Secreted protein n=1 Tax=Kibdelosporangium philippinense TaxID=211113 RepID=A0ABS8ZQP4_9PSEU|nr:hypothetical protein [Kibdelosporangium philippinense]MCE7009932.1 hypothetical protein [Kibdelosporangium philippinense]